MLSAQARIDHLVARIRERGSRLTPQRMAVLAALVNSDRHPTAEQIHNRVSADFPMTSLATIYKTLALLEEMGEVVEIAFSDDCVHYDGRTSVPHPHLICTKCREIRDLDLAEFHDLRQTVARKTGYRVLDYRFDLFGVCPQCQAQEQGSTLAG